MKVILWAAALIGIWTAGVSEAVETKVIVRAKSKDAKFIGSSMGGARVVIRESETGALLREGFTSGGTGDTEKLMIEPIQRGVPLSDATAAKYETTLEIDRPTRITVEVSAPAAPLQSTARSSTEVWLIPGKDLTGDGIILEIPGFAVTLFSPQITEGFKLTGEKATIPIRANIVMMCGCPITPGGLWDADQYEVKALLRRNGKPLEPLPLAYANKKNTFEGALEVSQEGLYEITVYTYDPRTGNTGVDQTTILVSR